MNWDKAPTLKEFANVFNTYVKDIGCMDNAQGWIGSHKIVGDICVYIDDPDDDTALEIVSMSIDQLGGCGCPVGIVIHVKRVKE